MNILFVCTGNTCRSAMAEAIGNRIINLDPEVYKDYHVSSAGTYCQEGAEASPEAVAVAAGAGCNLQQFKARQVTNEMIAEADYVFAMANSHKLYLYVIAPGAQKKIFLLTEFETDADWERYPDIEDPFGGTTEEYEKCFWRLEEAIQTIFNKIRNSNQTLH